MNIRTRRQGHKVKKKARKNKIKGEKKTNLLNEREVTGSRREREREIKLPTRVERERGEGGWGPKTEI